MHPISYLQAIILGLVQGVAEPFPISSLGHGVILPRLAGWSIHQNDQFFLTFLVATHLATAIVLLLFFRKDWARIIRGLGRSLRDREIGTDTDARLGWLLIVGTVPAGVLGLLFEHPLRSLFASAPSAPRFSSSTASCCSCSNAAAAKLRRLTTTSATAMHASRGSAGGKPSASEAPKPWRSSPASRGRASPWEEVCSSVSPTKTPPATASCLPRPSSVRRLLKLPELFGPEGNGVRGPALVGALCAGVTTFFAVKFLLKFFETNRLTPFAIYCTAAGIVVSLIFVFGG